MIDWVAVKKAGDKWDSVKEFFSRPDVAGASAGALIGGGLGAGLGLVTSPKKGLSAGVHGGIGALTGGLAGYGIGKSVMTDRENKKLDLRRRLENFLTKNTAVTKKKWDDTVDEDYTARTRAAAERALERVEEIYKTHGKESIDRLKQELWEATMPHSWMFEKRDKYGLNDRLGLEHTIWPEKQW